MFILLAILFTLGAKVLLLLLMNNAVLPLPDLLTLVGHTAGGKTSVAALLALRLHGEVISADSRQVYRGMDIGTGKDLDDYQICGQPIPYHLIDIVDAGHKYSLFDFQQDFSKAYSDIRERGKLPILCGGTGLYAEAILKGYNLTEVLEDEDLRASLELKSDEDLIGILKSMVPLHNQSDTTDRQRLIRAIEVARSKTDVQNPGPASLQRNAKVFGIAWDTETRRRRITERLSQRLENGMVEEVKTLLQTVNPADLMYYGLEYKYLTLYCLGEISYSAMFSTLNTAIHQFAKRQMTWFRGMERRGIPITWIPADLPLEEKVEAIIRSLD
jgi:tRNA dimethylallyltransferase